MLKLNSLQIEVKLGLYQVTKSKDKVKGDYKTLYKELRFTMVLQQTTVPLNIPTVYVNIFKSNRSSGWWSIPGNREIEQADQEFKVTLGHINQLKASLN